MDITPEQNEIGKDNFNEAVGFSRRALLKTAAAGGAGLGALYFNYEKLNGAPVKTAFIGCGDEANVLITEHPSDYMEIVAIADPRPANIERTFKGSHPEVRIGLNKKLGQAKASEIRVYGDHEALLKDKDALGLEMVVIAVPLSQHAPIALACMEAGLHVLTEKLMAHNVTECKQMIRTAEKKGLLLAVGHQRHYSVLYDNANSLIRQGLLGDIKFIRAQWHRNNSFPGSDSWKKWDRGAEAKKDKEHLLKLEKEGRLQALGYDSARQLVDWRLYNKTGGGLMAELGSHQMDAASIFLGKVHTLAVQGYGQKNFYGVKGVGPKENWDDDRDIADHIYVTFEFPGAQFKQDQNDIAIVTYSSINTNRLEFYGETVFGSRGTLIMKEEKEALLYKEQSPGSGGGLDQRLWVLDSSAGGGPVLDSYNTAAPSAGAAMARGAVGDKVSRGYREEMEHFCYCVRNGKGWQELRCNGRVAMADAIMALTANLAMKTRKRIEFREEWFDADHDAAPETDAQVLG